MAIATVSYGQITGAVTQTVSYGLITDAVTSTRDDQYLIQQGGISSLSNIPVPIDREWLNARKHNSV